MARHYLDHSSTMPLRPEARAALQAWLDDAHRPDQHPEAGGDLGDGDPSRIHAEGLRSRAMLEHARTQVAELLGARSREVVFTSGATEAITAATWGSVRRAVELGFEPHVVLAAVEHSAVREASTTFAEAFGGHVSVVDVDHLGRIDPDTLMAEVRDDTALVHVQWANHEVPTVQPVHEIVALCRERGVLTHVDGAQAAGRVPVGFADLGADLLSVSGHKLGGPPGTGALLVRRGLRLAPLLQGGDQERARRAGLENVPALVGLGAVAAGLTTPDDSGRTRLDHEREASVRLTDRLLAGLAGIDGVHPLGDTTPEGRLPHLVCVSIDGIEPQGVLLGLDRAGVAAHSGSACSSESLEPSPVLQAMGVDAHRSLRLSVGWNTTQDDVDVALRALPDVIGRLRALAT